MAVSAQFTSRELQEGSKNSPGTTNSLTLSIVNDRFSPFVPSYFIRAGAAVQIRNGDPP